MTVWYDSAQERYRESLPFKFFYRWIWPASRWLMFRCMPSEHAHWFGLHIAIPMVALIDRVWGAIVFAAALALIAVCAALVKLPGFYWSAEQP